MDYKTLINSIPIVCFFAILISGYSFFQKSEFLSKKIRISIILGGIFAMQWNLGIAWSSLAYDFEIAKYGVYIELWGFNAFYFFIIFFVGEYIGLKKETFHTFLSVGLFLAIVDGFFFGMGDVHEYVWVRGRTAYLTKQCAETYFHFAYIISFAVIWNVQVISYCLKNKYKRQKEFGIKGIIPMWLLFFLSIPDTLLPVFGIPSFPSSGVGVTIAYFFLLQLVLKFNLFSISKDNLSDYIFNLPNIGILVFDLDWKLSISNSFSEKLLGIISANKQNLKEIFHIDETVIKTLENEKEPENHLSAISNGVSVAVTPAIARDKYGDPFCYILIVSDMTYEEEKVQLEKAEIRKQQIDKMLIQIVEALGITIDAKDQYTKGHSTRVSNYSVLIAKELGFTDEQLEEIRYAGLLHDIGKIGIPDSVLKKPGKLTEEEFDIIKSHTTVGANILMNLDSLPGAKDAAHYHHERYDGKGYPENIRGTDIPLISRIICVADAFDAMNSSRVYRSKLTTSDILKELENGRGSQFDTEVIDAAINLIKTDKIQ